MAAARERVRIRPAELGDAEEIARLAHGLNLVEGRPTGLLTPQAVRRDGFGAGALFETLVAARGGQVVGYAIFYPAYETAYAAAGLYLSDLFVQPDARRRGVGRRLVAALAAEARRRRLDYLWWASRPDNAAANRFYRGLGAGSRPILANALTFQAFETLADEGERA